MNIKVIFYELIVSIHNKTAVLCRSDEWLSKCANQTERQTENPCF